MMQDVHFLSQDLTMAIHGTHILLQDSQILPQDLTMIIRGTHITLQDPNISLYIFQLITGCIKFFFKVNKNYIELISKVSTETFYLQSKLIFCNLKCLSKLI